MSTESDGMKPGDFFVSVMDFFAILLPGAILAYLLKPFGSVFLGPLWPRTMGEAERWVAFAVAAYVFGHILHHLGSILDRAYDLFYVRHRRRFGDDPLFAAAKLWVERDLGEDAEKLSRFEWAGAWVRARAPVLAGELERLVSESKFFRSLCVVAAIAALVFLLIGHPLGAVCAAALSVFSYRRFCLQRWKSTQSTYLYFLLLRQTGKRGPGPRPLARG